MWPLCSTNAFRVRRTVTGAQAACRPWQCNCVRSVTRERFGAYWPRGGVPRANRLFYSHRRDRGHTGTMAAALALRPHAGD